LGDSIARQLRGCIEMAPGQEIPMKWHQSWIHVSPRKALQSRVSVPQQGSLREHRLCLAEDGSFGGNGATCGRRTLL